jgi:hypothetical protein
MLLLAASPDLFLSRSAEQIPSFFLCFKKSAFNSALLLPVPLFPLLFLGEDGGKIQMCNLRNLNDTVVNG